MFYVRHDKKETIVNLQAHKSLVARDLIEARGATLLFLPPYSPDLNPIEMSFSKLKSVLRKEKIRDLGKLREFLRDSPCLFSSIECENDFKHAGYCLNSFVKRSGGLAPLGPRFFSLLKIATAYAIIPW